MLRLDWILFALVFTQVRTSPLVRITRVMILPIQGKGHLKCLSHHVQAVDRGQAYTTAMYSIIEHSRAFARIDIPQWSCCLVAL